MFYACVLESPQALLMLSESGASLEPALALLDTWHDLRKPVPIIYKLIAKACRNRLEELLRLGIAHDCAGDAQLTQFPHPLELLNKITRALTEKGVEIPVSISSAIPRRPFGHLKGLNVFLAESLWDQGLLLLDERHDGAFPILRHLIDWRHKGLRDWLLSKNARLDIPTGVKGLDVAHMMAASFGLFSSNDKLMRACLSYKAPIGLGCFCMGDTSIFIPIRRHLPRYLSLYHLLRDCHRIHLLAEQPSDFLRALTFGALQVTHTCPLLQNPYDWYNTYIQSAEEDHNWELPMMEAAEIEEIHQEEDELIIRFERLLDELIAEYHESHLSFPEFLDLVWFPRMLDEVDRFDPRTAGFLDEIREFLNEPLSDDASDGEQSDEDQSDEGGDD